MRSGYCSEEDDRGRHADRGASSTKNKDKKRDGEMSSTKKGKTITSA